MSEKVEASQKTLKIYLFEVYRDGTIAYEVNGKHKDGHIRDLLREHEIFEGLVADLQTRIDDLEAPPREPNEEEMIWIKSLKWVLSRLGVEDLTLTNVEATKFPDGSVLTRKDYSPKKKKQK